ncbi:MAG: DUF2971 domain-containing protein [Bryobacteraceae bacterium]|jgi:hypothetical protein
MTEARRNPLEAGIARLYHYERFREDWLATTLREQKIHCSDPTNLNDPWDCRPWFDYRPMAEDPAQREAMLAFRKPGTDNHPKRATIEDGIRNSPDQLREYLSGLSESLQREICKRRIYCLTPDPCSTLMWSHYADRHRGICLEFHLGNVLFLKAREVMYRSAYPVWVPQEMPAIADQVVLTKSEDWKDEKEWRLVGSPNYAEGYPLKPEGDYFRLPPQALQSVIVGCEAGEERYEAVRSVVHEHAPGLPVKRVTRAPNHYRLEIIAPVPDPSGLPAAPSEQAGQQL